MKKLITLLLIVLTSCVSTKQEQPQVRNSQTTEIKVVQKVEENSKNIEKLLYYYTGQDKENDSLKYRIDVLEKRIDTLETYHKPIEFPEPLEEKAFPTVKGAGKYVTGGRGGIVVKVTNLNNSGPGSFREALMMTVPRIIVFYVSGTIRLTSAIELIKENSNFTVAGQTAPQGGITISGHLIQIGGGYNRAAQPCDNIIFRYIRFRNGRYNGQSDVREHNGVLSTGSNGLVFDHCSFSFCDDQALALGGDFGDFKNVTIQNCIFSENATQVIIALNGAYPEKDITVINNAFIDTSQRTPNIGGDGQYDVINNYYFNWVNRLTNINAGSPEVNYIGNYLKEGTYTTSGSGNKYQNGSATIYTANNYHSRLYVSPKPDDRNIWQDFFNNGSVSSSRFTTTMHPLLNDVEIVSALEVPELILNNVGADKFLNSDGSFGTCRDSFDELKINNAKNNVSSNPYNKNWVLPTLPNNKRANDYDANNDGLPDALEYLLPKGKKPTDLHESGYSYLEVLYLNNVDK